jgi:hypothetical protein
MFCYDELRQLMLALLNTRKFVEQGRASSRTGVPLTESPAQTDLAITPWAESGT